MTVAAHPDAHAAVNPQDGINALDALVQTYTGIGVMRQQLRPDARIHGIITHGGDAPNIIPAYAAARYYVRARDREYLAELEHRVRRVAEGAALQAGASVEITNPEPTYEDTRPNLTLGRAFRRTMEALGLRVEDDDPQAGGSSTDFGNLSQRLPGVSAKFSISGERRVPGHSEALRDAAGSDEGQRAISRTGRSSRPSTTACCAPSRAPVTWSRTWPRAGTCLRTARPTPST